MKFQSEAANRLQRELNSSQESPKVAAARRVLGRAQPGAQRRRVAEQVLDEVFADGTETERREIWEIAREFEVGEAEETGPPPPARPVAEPERPYVDDEGRLRDPAGRFVDPDSEDWWDESWANDAAALLGPEWMAGR